MRISRFLDSIVIRRMLPQDVALRVALLQDPAVMRNIVDVAAIQPASNLISGNLDRLEHGWTGHLDYVFQTKEGQILGFGWLADIDWIDRRCEFSIAILPEHRTGLGRLCYMAMMRHVYTQLGMESIYCQVYESNHMMMGTTNLASIGTVRSPDDVYVAGRWRTCYSWIESRDEFVNQAQTP
jgi:RimJ/RimL family protein N-acetyltransferase